MVELPKRLYDFTVIGHSATVLANAIDREAVTAPTLLSADVDRPPSASADEML